MSRIKSTLDSVSKAVVNTHNELIARIRFKPTPGIVEKAPENNDKIKQECAANTLVPGTTTQEDHKETLAVRNPVDANGKLGLTLTSLNGTSQQTTKDSSDAKNSLFHESYFTTNFGETYNFLANHINLYFGNYINMAESKKRRQLCEEWKE